MMKKSWIGLFGLLLFAGIVAIAAPFVSLQAAETASQREAALNTHPVSRPGPIRFIDWASAPAAVPTADIYRCPYPLPPGLVQGRMKHAVYALSRPDETAVTDIVIQSGTSWWIMGVEGAYYQLWIACEGSPVWVLADVMMPNNDPVWHGAPLPVAGMALLRVLTEL